MALSVTTRALTWRYLSDPDSALLLTRLVREMGTLARALGIAISDRAVLPVASLCAAGENEAVARILQLGEEYRRNAPTHRLSALQDVEAGRPLEVHETLGYASTKARELGLDLPLLAAFTRLLAAIDRTRRAALSSP
jgi:ketopantoate reductase